MDEMERHPALWLPYPHAGQRVVRQEALRFNWLCAGRRWRKTSLGVAVMLEAAAAGQRWIWGAPTRDQVRVAWEEALRAAGALAEFRKSEMTADFPGGGQARFRSLDDPDNARGWTADGVVIDECAEVVEAAWYEVLRPMLIDTGGVGWFLFTPKGQNWVWRESMLALERADSRFWNAPTLGAILREDALARLPHPLENPHIDFAEIQQLFGSLPERVFRQEILAEFLEESGGVFRRVREAVDAGRRENEPPRPGALYVVGVDLARVRDWTVVTVLDVKAKRQVYHERFQQISWERQLATVARVAGAYGNARVLLDSTGVGDPFYEALRRQRVNAQGFCFSNGSKEALIDRLAMGLEQGELRLMDVASQTAELHAFQYELTEARNVRMCAPSGLHDDCVIALALAWWYASQYRERPTSRRGKRGGWA